MKPLLHIEGKPHQRDGIIVSAIETFTLCKPCEFSAKEYTEAVKEQYGKETVGWIDTVFVSECANKISQEIANIIHEEQKYTTAIFFSDYFFAKYPQAAYNAIHGKHVLVIDEPFDFLTNFVLDMNPSTVAIFNTNFVIQ